MITAISCILGSKSAVQPLHLLQGEDLVLNVTVRSGTAAHNGTGGYVGCTWRFGAQSPERLRLPGRVDGLYSIQIPAAVWRWQSGIFELVVWWYPPVGAPIALTETFEAVIEQSVGPWGEDSQEDPPPVPLEVAVQQTIEFTATLDLPGEAVTLTAGPATRCPLGSATPIRVTCPQLRPVTGIPDPLAFGTLQVSRLIGGVKTPVGAAATLAQLTGADSGIFTGAISRELQGTLGANLAVQYAVTITVGGVPYYARLATDLTYVDQGFPANYDPVVVLGLTSGSEVLPGAVSIPFTCTDADDVLTGENFRAILEGNVVGGPATLTSGSGTGNIAGYVQVVLTSAVAYTIGVRCTDPRGGVATRTISVTVVQPTLAITSPVSGGPAVDEGPRHVTAASVPALPGATVLSVWEGDTLLGTGTLAAGVTTSPLLAGTHTITARVVTAAGAVNSLPIVFTAQAQAPMVAFAYPTNGLTSVPSALVTVLLNLGHVGGLSEIAEVAAWRDSQARVIASRVGTSAQWQAAIAFPNIEGTYVLHADATDFGGTVTTATTVTLTHDYSVVWDGTYAFGRAYATMVSPASSTQELVLSSLAASDNDQLRVTFPAGVIGANIVPPSGYRLDWTTPIVPVAGAALYGLVPWSYGGTWTVLLEIDTVDHVVRASASWAYVAPADLIWHQRSSVAGGTVIDSWPEDTDPLAATYGVTRGTVRHGGTGAFVDPTALSSAGMTVLGWYKVHTTAGSPSVSAFGSSYEPSNSAAEIGLGDSEISASGDVVETWGGLPAQGLYLNPGNSSSWPADWENNSGTDRISFGGFDTASGQQRFPQLRNRWVCWAVTLSGNIYTRYCNGMVATTQSLGGVTATAPDGIVIGAERNGIAVGRHSEAYYGDIAILPRAASLNEVRAFCRETRGTLTATSNSSLSCVVIGSSFVTLEEGQAHRMAYYLVEQATALGVTLTVLADFAQGAQGVATPSGTDTNLRAQVDRLLLDHQFHRGILVLVDWMSAVNEQALYATSRADAISMVTTELDRLRAAGCTIIMPEVSSCVLGGVIYGPNARADQLSEWIAHRGDTCMLWINAALQADPHSNFWDQGTPGVPESYGPHLAEPVTNEVVGKRLVARSAVQAMIGLHHNRLGKYARP